MILISRSKKKIIGLDGFGLKIKKQIIINEKILIVNANYYKDISEKLLLGTKKLKNNSFKISIINVPGIYEIPIAIRKYITSLMVLLL